MSEKECKTCKEHEHPDHSKRLAGLNRAIGQLEGVKRMIQNRRSCDDILTQLRAARSAVKTIESKVLEQHLHACMTDALVQKTDPEEAKQRIESLVKTFKRHDD